MYSHPLNAVFVPLLDEPDALEDVGDVVDAPLLLHLQHVRGNLQVQQAVLGLLWKLENNFHLEKFCSRSNCNI